MPAATLELTLPLLSALVAAVLLTLMLWKQQVQDWPNRVLRRATLALTLLALAQLAAVNLALHLS